MAYVYAGTGSTWTVQAKLVAQTPGTTPAADAAPGDDFGFSVAVDGDTAAVGSPGDDDGGSGSGSAYVYTRTGSTWTVEAKLAAQHPGTTPNSADAAADDYSAPRWRWTPTPPWSAAP